MDEITKNSHLPGGIQQAFYSRTPKDSEKSSYKRARSSLYSMEVCNVGNQKCAPGHQWGPGVRDHYLIHHIVSGKGIYRCSGREFQLQAGDSFIIYPHQEVFYKADQEDPWEYSWVGFAGNDAPNLLHSSGFSSHSPVKYNSSHQDEIRALLYQIFETRGTDLAQTTLMTGYLYMLMSIYISESDQLTKPSQAENYVAGGIDYISTNYSQPITVEDIADYIGISRSHLFRSFQSILGKSPKEYLTEYRIQQACYLLTHTGFSMKEVAESVGFENSLYFSKAFAKQMGMPPTAYAKTSLP